MALVTLYTSGGASKGEMTLDDRLFAVPVNPTLVHQAVVAQMANARAPIAHTKMRGEVAGSGKKPWKQKGTGRARHGSRRSPIWIGGGITFGPRRERNFSIKINRKARRKALAMVLSDKLNSGHVVVVEALNVDDGKTKSLVTTLAKLPSSGKKTLIVTPPDQRVVKRAARNLPGIATIPANALNVVDLLRFEYLLMTEGAVAMVTELYQPNSL